MSALCTLPSFPTEEEESTSPSIGTYIKHYKRYLIAKANFEHQ